MLIRTCKKSGISDNVVFNKIKGKLQANSHCQKKTIYKIHNSTEQTRKSHDI